MVLWSHGRKSLFLTEHAEVFRDGVVIFLQIFILFKNFPLQLTFDIISYEAQVYGTVIRHSHSS